MNSYLENKSFFLLENNNEYCTFNSRIDFFPKTFKSQKTCKVDGNETYLHKNTVLGQQNDKDFWLATKWLEATKPTSSHEIVKQLPQKKQTNVGKPCFYVYIIAFRNAILIVENAALEHLQDLHFQNFLRASAKKYASFYKLLTMHKTT